MTTNLSTIDAWRKQQEDKCNNCPLEMAVLDAVVAQAKKEYLASTPDSIELVESTPFALLTNLLHWLAKGYVIDLTNLDHFQPNRYIVNLNKKGNT